MPAESRSDVVVIGGGGSGLAAAIEARRRGATVTLLEKNPRLGGSTAWSVGSVTATQTPHQRRAGILDDTPDDHFEDLGKFAGDRADRDNLRLRRILVDEAPAMFSWLLESGIVFLGPALEPPHRRPRMHNVVPGSRAFPHQLGRVARSLGIRVLLSTRAEEVLREGNRVNGVAATDANDERHIFHASRAVVLTTGDISGSAALKARFASEAAARTSAVNVTNTGDGHTMGLALGGSVVNGDLVHGPIMRFVPPTAPTLLARIPPYAWIGRMASFAMAHVPSALLRPLLMSFVTTALGPDPGLFKAGGVLISAQGRRIAGEPTRMALELAAQDGGVGYIVLDRTMSKQFAAWPHFVSTAPNVAYAYLPDYKRNRPDVYREAASVDALAQALGVDAALLRNALGATEGTRALEPPLVALGPVKSYIVLTEGGLAVSDDHEVLGPGSAPIPGLYAAGSAGQGGLLLYGHGHHLGWAFVSGRRAGRQAAKSPAG